jgi:hypothetical protein
VSARKWKPFAVATYIQGAASLALWEVWNQRSNRVQIEKVLTVHTQWANWCHKLKGKLDEIGNRQAVVETLLERKGLLRWSDFDK